MFIHMVTISDNVHQVFDKTLVACSSYNGVDTSLEKSVKNRWVFAYPTLTAHFIQVLEIQPWRVHG